MVSDKAPLRLISAGSGSFLRAILRGPNLFKRGRGGWLRIFTDFTSRANVAYHAGFHL